MPLHLPDDVAYCWRTYDPTAARQWNRLLSPEERERLRAFGHPKRQREFVLGRVAARTLLAERLGVEPGAVPLRIAEDGGVDVEGHALFVSIAHAEGHAVAAVAERAVGIDLERIRLRHPDLHRFLLHPEEYGLLKTLPLDQAHLHILCWTLKESTLKGLRTGFRLSPKKLRLAVDLAGRMATVRVERQRWQVQFEERAGCYLAVSYAAQLAHACEAVEETPGSLLAVQDGTLR